MKLRLNKTVLSQIKEMSVQAFEIVNEWQTRYRKANISVENRDNVYISEDSRYTMVNILTKKSASGQASGEFAGSGNFSCNTQVPLPAECIMIEQGFFMGVPHLTIFQGVNSSIQIAL